jgi:hypothetical protein
MLEQVEVDGVSKVIVRSSVEGWELEVKLARASK